MKLGVEVGEVMTRNFIHAKPDMTLSDCASKMIKNKVGSLIIKEKNKLLGLLTNRDILRAIVEKKDISKLSANNLMAKKIATIKPNKDVYDAIILMNQKKIRQLPVISENKVIGMLTIKDILKIEPTLLDSVCDLAEIKEARAKHKTTGIRTYRERKALASGDTWIREGQCDECDEYDVLFNVDGELLCEECRDEVK